MSDNCITIGWIGVLKEPATKENHDTICDLLDDYGFGINYEGTLVYKTEVHESISDGFGIHVLGKGDEADRFYDDVWSAGFSLNRESVRPFVDLWYNGADSGHSDITLAQFQEKLK